MRDASIEADTRVRMSGVSIERSRGGLTRGWILESFNRLVRKRGYDFGVTDVVEGAGVGRSTFYEHYRGKNGVRREAMRHFFETLASIVDRRDEEPTRLLIEHIATHRPEAHRLLVTAKTEIARELADSVEPRLSGRFRIARHEVAAQIASVQLGLLEGWLAFPEEPFPPAALAEAFHAATGALTARFTQRRRSARRRPARA
jgi:AcrR family transcriptional regulator